MAATRAIVFCGAASLCVLALAPAWVSPGHRILSLGVFAFFSKVCHQRLERSFVLFGAPVAVCVRCMGVYAGAALGSLMRLDARPALRFFGAALALNCLDVAAESAGLHGNMPLLRLLIGGSLGIAAGAMLSVHEPMNVGSRESTGSVALKT